MNLNNFGSILNFAKEIEAADDAFYSASSKNSSCKEYSATFEEFAQNLKKNIKVIERTLRENITEMILERIEDFSTESFSLEIGNVDSMEKALESAKNIERRAIRYYSEAALKLKALSEVARNLKMLAKKRESHLNKLNTL